MILAEDLGSQHTHGGLNHPNSISQGSSFHFTGPRHANVTYTGKTCMCIHVQDTHTDTQIFDMLSRTPFKILNEKRHIVVYVRFACLCA